MLALEARAVSSCLGELSMPTGLAPRRASQAETYPVPQPSSMASSPSRSSGSRWSSDSGTPKMPHVSSLGPIAQLSSPLAT